MAVYEALLLNTVVPQIQAAQTGDSYVMVVNATTPALRITQTGTGNALEVEDSANPDATPFVVTAAGDVGIGTNAPNYLATLYKATLPVLQLVNSTSGSAAADGLLIYLNGANATISNEENGSIAFQTSGTLRATLDSSGNLGLGVTPSAWGGAKAFEAGLVGNYFIGSTAASYTSIGTASYYNGSNWVYARSTAASKYELLNNTHAWYIAPSGTANTTTITNGVSYTIITSGNQTAFGAADNNVGTSFTATSSGTLSSGTVSQNISFTQAMTLDASGNLIVGNTSGNVGFYGKAISLAATASAYAGLEISGTTGGALEFQTSQSTRQVQLLGNSSGFIVNVNGGSGLAERARITSGGYFKASNNGAYDGVSSAYHELYQSADNRAVIIANVNASATTDGVVFVRVDRNTTNNTFYALSYYNAGAAAYKFRVADSGDVTNTNGTYGTISDQKMKTDIVDAGSQWSDIKALRFRKFKMKDDPSGLVQLGVVAQEVELTSPGLVDEHQDRDAEGNDLGTTTKSVKTSVLLMKAAVALQEAMARIETLEAEVAALKGA